MHGAWLYTKGAGWHLLQLLAAAEPLPGSANIIFSLLHLYTYLNMFYNVAADHQNAQKQKKALPRPPSKVGASQPQAIATIDQQSSNGAAAPQPG